MPKLVQSSEFTVHSKENSVKRERKTLNRRFWRLGFTIYELLIVITIIAILSTIGFIGGGNVLSRIRDSHRITDVNAIKLSLEAFYEKNSRYPFDSTNPSKQLFFSSDPQPWIPEIVTQGYSQELPKDPKQAATSPLTRLAQILLDALEIKQVAATHEYVPPSGMHVKLGQYIGNGEYGRQITEIGFQPELVIIKGDSTIRATAHTSTMPSGFSKNLVGSDGLSPDRIISLDNDGFTLGWEVEVNEEDIPYYYLAVAADDSPSDNFKTFSYTGNGVDGQSITGCGFQPDMVIIFPQDGYSTVWRTSAMTGDNSQSFEWGMVEDLIQALEPSGFQIGLDIAVNVSDSVYHAVCVKNTPNIFNALPGYQGSAPDIPQQSITGTGFFPDFVLLKSDGSDVGAIRLKGIPTGLSGSLSGEALGPNGIIALEGDGFRIGSDPSVNASWRIYYSAVWQETAPPSLSFFYLYHVSTDRKTYNVWASLENTKDPGIFDHTTAQCKTTPPIKGYNYCGAGF